MKEVEFEAYSASVEEGNDGKLRLTLVGPGHAAVVLLPAETAAWLARDVLTAVGELAERLRKVASMGESMDKVEEKEDV